MEHSLLKPLPNGHSLFAPSASGRWISCPGSISLAHEIEKDQTKEDREPMSIYAAEGTLMHKAAEKILKGQKPIKIGATRTIDGHKIKYTDEFDKAVQQYVDVVNWYLNEFGGTLAVEKRVTLKSYGYPSIKGTSDVVIEAPDTLIIGDLKGGAGHLVDVFNNTQLKIYSAAALDGKALLFNKVINFIVQPRHRMSQFFSAVEYTPDEVTRFVTEDVTGAIQNALSENPTFNPSAEACKWCPAKENMSCKAYADFAFQTAQSDFSSYKEFQPMDPYQLSIEDLATILDKLPLLNDFISAVNLYALDQLQKGVQIPGYKLVKGRANRKWSIEDTLKMAKALRDEFGLKNPDIYTRKLNGPAAIEKLLKDPELQQKLVSYIIKPDGKPTVAKDTDNRDAMEPENTPQQDFSGSSLLL